jgi:hypothetical protein
MQHIIDDGSGRLQMFGLDMEEWWCRLLLTGVGGSMGQV